MAKTRRQQKEKLVYNRKKQQSYQASLSPEKKAAKAQARAEIQPKASKIDRDRQEHRKVRLKKLKREVKAGRRRVTILEREKDNLIRKYVLKAEEPEVDGAQAKAAEQAFERAYRDPGVLQRLTHETPEEFDELWQLVKEPLAKINYRGEKRQRSAGQRQLLPDRVQLFITLLFLRQYPTYALLSFTLGGLSHLSLHHYIFRVLTALSGLDALQISWPTDAEMAKHMKKPANWPYPDKANVVASTDGTEIKVARPTKYAIGNKHYSAKKKQYALNVLLVVLLNGIIIYCSNPLPKMNDQAMFNESDIRQRFIGKPWGLIADSGFTLNSATAQEKEGKIIGMTPIKQPRGRKKAKKALGKQEKAAARAQKKTDDVLKEKGKEKRKRSKTEPNLVSEEVLDAGVAHEPKMAVPSLTDSQKMQNVELSRMRVIVENTNARLKIYKVIGSKLRHYRPGAKSKDEKGITPALIMKIVAGLTNCHIKKSPCRSMDWVPEKVTEDDLESLEGSVWGDESSDEFESDE